MKGELSSFSFENWFIWWRGFKILASQIAYLTCRIFLRNLSWQICWCWYFPSSRNQKEKLKIWFKKYFFRILFNFLFCFEISIEIFFLIFLIFSSLIIFFQQNSWNMNKKGKYFSSFEFIRKNIDKIKQPFPKSFQKTSFEFAHSLQFSKFSLFWSGHFLVKVLRFLKNQKKKNSQKRFMLSFFFSFILSGFYSFSWMFETYKKDEENMSLYLMFLQSTRCELF